MPRKQVDLDEIATLSTVSAQLSARLAEAEEGHVRNAVVHLERAIAELNADEQEATEAAAAP